MYVWCMSACCTGCCRGISLQTELLLSMCMSGFVKPAMSPAAGAVSRGGVDLSGEGAFSLSVWCIGVSCSHAAMTLLPSGTVQPLSGVDGLPCFSANCWLHAAFLCCGVSDLLGSAGVCGSAIAARNLFWLPALFAQGLETQDVAGQSEGAASGLLL